MGTFTTILEIITPVFTTIGLGVLAKRKNMISENENKGLQQFVMKFGLPCVLFNSCLTCSMGIESLASMIMVFPLILLSSVWSFLARKKFLPYHNLPMMFSAQECGMLGIPLFMTLFGTAQAYRMGVLDTVFPWGKEIEVRYFESAAFISECISCSVF